MYSLNRIPLLFTISILVLGLIPFYAAEAVPPASTLYMVSKTTGGTNAPSQLWTVDSATGDAHPLPNPVGLDACTGMDFHQGSRILYAACERDAGSTNILATINTNTGIGTEVGPNGNSNINYGDVSFRAVGSSPILFAIEGDLSGHDLGTMDLDDGAFTAKAGPSVSRPGNGLAWTLDSGTIYRAGTFAGVGVIETLNPDTGAIMTSQALDYSAASPLAGEDKITAMDYDPATGTLWAAIKDDSSGGSGTAVTYLATIDPSDGDVENVVLISDAYVTQNGIIGVDGIAWLNETPIGGELLPINTAALLIAGIQSSALWMIPFVVSAIGIGAVLIRKKISF